ncbi:hypothetical protein NUH87_14295 [Pseudomonas batumici]|uniref:hypothetical protein n=1 Tax=Pseudomonas batumici TaxID=226910 RepID=UPI0030D12C96
MNRSVLLGLFVSACVLAAPAFASAEKDLCAVNLQSLNSAKPQLDANQQANLETSIQQAKAAADRNTNDSARECVAITSRALQEIQNHPKSAQ